MMSSRLPASLLALVCFLTGINAKAATTKTFDPVARDVIPRGELDQATYASRGHLSLGASRQSTSLDTKEIWDSLVGMDDKVYFVTGTPASLYRIDPATTIDGVEKRAAATLMYQAPEVALTCLAQGLDGRFYAGSMPSGRVYVIGPDGRGEVLATIPTPYVWSLIVDREGHLFAGCGPEGVIYRVRSDGQGHVEAYYDTRDSNVLSMAMGPDGGLYAATSGHGRIYRIEAAGKAQVVHDFEDREIRAISIREGVVYAATNHAEESSAPSSGSSGKATEFSSLGRNLARKFQGFEFIQEDGKSADTEGGRLNLNLPKSGRGGDVMALYPDGRVQIVHTVTTGFLMDLAIDGTGRLYVGLGHEGRVLRLEEEGQWTLLTAAPGALVSTLAAGSTGIKFAGYSNPGMITTWSPEQRATRGHFRTPPFDATVVSRWGNIEASLQGDVTVVTRSGNTREPDPTWSEWAQVGPGLPGGVSSPAGRFLQIEVIWKNDPLAQLSSLKAYYLNENQTPRIESFALEDLAPRRSSHPREDSEETTLSDSSNRDSNLLTGKKMSPGKKGDGLDVFTTISDTKLKSSAGSPLQFIWKASDVDGDRLVYRLSYRPLPGSPWLPITGKDPLEESSFSWETSSVPDGRHIVRLEVSDERSNPPGEGRTTRQEVSSVVVDNGRPKVVGLAFDRESSRISGTARDEMSPIRRLEYQIDGLDWKVFFPKDRLMDSSLEEFDFSIEPLDNNAHVIGVRAIDGEGNVGLSILVVGEKS